MNTTHAPPGSTSRRRAHPSAALLAAALAVVALTLAGCAAPVSEPPPPTEPADTEPADTEPAEPAEDLPAADEPTVDPDSPLAFSAVDLAGVEVDVADLAGEPVVLWFWAPWCTICRGEGPHVADVAAALDGQVTFLGIAGRGEVPDMEVFVSDTGTGSFTHLVDDDGSLWQRFGVSYQPAYAFIAPDGTVDVRVGALGSIELTDRAEALIG